jgi:hypothetical protein
MDPYNCEKNNRDILVSGFPKHIHNGSKAKTVKNINVKM